MASSPLSSKPAPVVIVGAGVFGLSTALHLAERGYTNVKVIDRLPYQQARYRYSEGCDAASAGKMILSGMAKLHVFARLLMSFRYEQDYPGCIWASV